MTNTLILADLHLDFWQRAGVNPLDQIEFEGVEMLIIAGDLTNKPRVRWKQAFDLIGARIPLERVHVFPGNHDYFDFRLDGDDRLAEIAQAAGARFAQKSVITCATSRYLCCTLWSDFRVGAGSPEAKAAEASRIVNDYRYIRIGRHGYRKVRPSDTIAVHLDHVAWLEARLSEPFAGETIVVTHHAPHPFALSPSGSVPQAYASDLSNLIKRFQPDRWLFGHTHFAAEFTIGATKLRNVSVGYPEKAE